MTKSVDSMPRSRRTNPAIRLQDQLFVEGNAKPYEAMIGKQIPGLPGASNSNWVGGTPPALTGKPYLIRFWATWCSSCQDDVPALSQFVNSGGTVIGMHPKADTNDVLRVMKQTKLLHPTFVSDEDSGWYAQKIANYPSPMFPYYLLVDGQGVAVAHGLLSDEESGILAKYRELVAGTTPADQPSQLSAASATDEPPKQPVVTPAKVPEESEMMEVAIRVNYKNQPVAGAMVHPEYYGGLGGNEPTDVEPKLTDATGMATFRLKKRYGENFETKSFHVRVRHTDFCYRYEHNAPIENGVITLSLTKGYRVLVDAIDDDTKTAITSDIYAGDLHNGIWRRQDDGRLLSPMLRYDQFGNRAIGLTQIRDQQVIGFSDLVRVRPLRKQRQVMATKIPIHPPVMLSGELDSSVPRPVRNSRVMVVVKRALRRKSGKVNTWGPEWVDWMPVGSDGTFQFDALPRGGEVELLAICDDEFISSATAVQGMGMGITPGMFLGYLQPMKIQLGNENKSVTVAMRPMTSAKVRLLDPQSKPVAGANVMARPHHRWHSHLGQPLFHSLRSRDMLLGREPGPTYRESPSGITDENGIATLESIIPGSYMVTVKHPTLEMRPNPHTPHVRDVDVKFQGGKVPSGKAPSGKVNELNIRLVPKGTTKLGR
ncbi:Thiol:disulfide interchange protein DsbE [Rubripirellula tenax]|uniref:Thiol:disulfide interchange protein DsbE n=1 Tax=Rubripirellula tenax TaxID=2528015 RepID=A0A5C6EJZ4_9BACT|nr:hypothetical protein [Rubripirellula tenax]TWU47599.1 Thiol:disulfide interchange protein DsbE [Rubripirellula tenax]